MPRHAILLPTRHEAPPKNASALSRANGSWGLPNPSLFTIRAESQEQGTVTVDHPILFVE